jgi:hypothetical protein
VFGAFVPGDNGMPEKSPKKQSPGLFRRPGLGKKIFLFQSAGCVCVLCVGIRFSSVGMAGKSTLLSPAPNCAVRYL